MALTNQENQEGACCTIVPIDRELQITEDELVRSVENLNPKDLLRLSDKEIVDALIEGDDLFGQEFLDSLGSQSSFLCRIKSIFGWR